MKVLPKLLVVFVLLFTFAAVSGAEEMLDLSMLGDIKEAETTEFVEWTYPIPYELLKTSEYIVLANKTNLLDENYIPQDLVKDLDTRKISYDPIQMRQVAADALKALFDAAEADGLYIYAHSGYRSYKTQNTMYYNRLKKNNGKDDGVVAVPGSSDHQTGLGIDVINKAGIGKKFTEAFGKTKHGQWLAENC